MILNLIPTGESEVIKQFAFIPFFRFADTEPALES